MGIAVAVTAKKNMLRRSAEWRANRRSSGDVVFLQSEQASRDKYNEFTRLSREFSKTYPKEFKNFLLAKAEGRQVAQRFAPRHMSSLAPEGSSIPTIPITLPTTDSRVIPSAVAMESRRLASAGNKRLAELGIRLD
jgi:hypothetical protein